MAKKVEKKTTKPTKAASKKVTPKTSVKTRPAVQANAVAKTEKTTKRFPVHLTRKYVIFALAIIIVGALLYFGRGLFVAAIVNGQPISRIAVVKEAEKQSGQQALQGLIVDTLIQQEAKKKNVEVTEKEIDDEIKKVEESLAQQGQKLDDFLKTRGLTRNDVRARIVLQKKVEKIVGQDVTVSDEEVTQYLEENKDFLPTDQSEEELKKSIAESLKQQKLNSKINDWLTSLQTQAKIQYFVQY